MGKNVFKFNEEFVKNHDEDNNQGYVIEINVEYLKDLHSLHSDLPFLSERMKIKKCFELLCNLYDKKAYVIHKRALQQALNHGLILKGARSNSI